MKKKSGFETGVESIVKIVKREAKLNLVKDEMIAKRDFVICHNDYFKTIKVGDDLSDVPEMYWANLKTETVI